MSIQYPYLIFNHEMQRFEFIGSYETRMIPKAAKFRWDPVNKVWFTKSSQIASALAEYAEEEIKETLLGLSESLSNALDKSRAKDSEFEPECPDGQEFMPFQKAGIEWILSRNNTLLGDAMGLGKTISVIGAVNSSPRINNILVICPNSLKLNWEREIVKWQTRGLPVTTISSTDKVEKNTIKGWVIVNYDILEKFIEVLLTNWDMVALDECHYIKNKNAKRSILTKAIGAKATIKVAMTGTPIPNRPIEIWNVLNFLEPREWKSYWVFAKRYAKAYHNGWGWDVSGASHLDELREKLRTTVMIRRTKEEVLKDLPNKLRQVVEISPEGYATVLAYEAKTKERQTEIEGLSKKAKDLESSANKEEYEAIVSQLKVLQQLLFEEISRVRHETALAKVPEVISFIKDTLESVDKVVVFAHHRDVIENLRTGLIDYAPVTVHGDTRTVDRQHAVDEFQTNPGVRVFIGGIIPAGVGITLTAASTVVFAELDWVPGNVTQAEDRCHRIGTQNTVHIVHIVIDGSIDAKLAKTIVEKQKVIDKALDKDTRKGTQSV